MITDLTITDPTVTGVVIPAEKPKKALPEGEIQRLIMAATMLYNGEKDYLLLRKKGGMIKIEGLKKEAI